MAQTCTNCGTGYDITADEREFHKDMDVSAPKQCPHCRFVRRLTERNARSLHKRTCDLTGQAFISPYSETSFPVYHSDAWISDAWDDLSYGRDIDWNRPFFEQLKELFDTVPRQGQFICPGTLENSEYVNCAGYLKNCYLLAEADYNEKCMYGNRLYYNQQVVDCSNVVESELCYECVDVQKCYGCLHCLDCNNCSGCFFSSNCQGCKDCIGCINLRQKQYCIFNEQLSKEEYDRRKEELGLNTYDGIESLRNRVSEFFQTQPHRYVQMENTQNCTGDHLYDSKNALECVDCSDLEDCKYCARVLNVKSALDYTSWGAGAERIYFTAACGDQAYNLRFCTTCTTNVSDLTYCGHCIGCKNCFGCVGMKRKQYCILNKQYSKEEYEELLPKLIEHMKSTGEWGEFFPQDFGIFGYNETIAMEYFPLTKEEAIKAGYSWRDYSSELLQVDKTIAANDLPKSIDDIPDDIINWAVTCAVSGRPFKITQQELQFYRQLNLPIPHLHPDERHNRRMTLRPSRIFYDRQCDKCAKDIRTTFSPEQPETVYCEECYLQSVY